MGADLKFLVPVCPFWVQVLLFFLLILHAVFGTGLTILLTDLTVVGTGLTGLLTDLTVDGTGLAGLFTDLTVFGTDLTDPGTDLSAVRNLIDLRTDLTSHLIFLLIFCRRPTSI